LGGRAQAATSGDGINCAAQTNKVSTARLGRPRGSAEGLVTAQPDAMLTELRDALRTSAALATIWRELNQLDLTIKKNRTRRRTTTR
jgi:hypothetical protein